MDWLTLKHFDRANDSTGKCETRPLGRVLANLRSRLFIFQGRRFQSAIGNQKSAMRRTLPNGFLFYAEYQRTAKKWQVVPAITKRCQAKWL